MPAAPSTGRIEDIRGRHEDGFVYPDGRSVHPYVFESALAGERNLVDYQIRQTRRGASVVVVCQGEVDLEQLRVKVSAGLTALAINEPDVQVTRVERLPRLASGKLKRFIPRPMRATPEAPDSKLCDRLLLHLPQPLTPA